MSIMDSISVVVLALLIILPFLWQLSTRFQYLVKIAALYLCFLLTSIFSVFFVIWRPFEPNNHKIVFNVFKFLTPWVKIKYEVRGTENFEDLPHGCIMVANHQSSLDLHGMAWGKVWPDRGIILIKKSLMYAGMVGVSAWLSGSVFIDRFNPNQARATMDKSLQKLRDKKCKMLVFAEGTRNHGDGMLPFKKGAFHLAVQAQIPVVPVVFSSYKPFYSKNEWRWQGEGRVVIQVLPKIPTAGLTSDDVTRLSQETREKMVTVFDKISVEGAEWTKRVNEGVAE